MSESRDNVGEQRQRDVCRGCAKSYVLWRSIVEVVVGALISVLLGLAKVLGTSACGQVATALTHGLSSCAERESVLVPD